MNRKFVSLFLSVMLLFSICMSVNAADLQSIQQEYLINEYNANTYHTNLTMHYKDTAYPAHYGGSYINEITGNLVINLTERSDEIEQLYYDVCQAEHLEFRIVTYSISELINMSNRASAYMFASGNDDSSLITGSAIIQRDNQIEVYTNSKTRSTTEMIYSIVGNSDVVVIKEYDGNLQLEAGSGRPGAYIKTPTNASGTEFADASMGYLATYWNGSSTEIGFVSAGHAFFASASTKAYDNNGELLGTVTRRVGNPGTSGITNTGDLDYAFIKLASGVSLSRAIAGTTIEQDTVPVIPAEGSIIFRSGAVNGIKAGTVISLYFVDGTSSDDFETEMRRMLLSNMSSKGDSGGILYTSAINNKAKVAGIHQGGGTIDGDVRSAGIFAFKMAADGVLVR